MMGIVTRNVSLLLRTLLGGIGFVAVMSSAHAAEPTVLRIGMAAQNASMDPHFQNSTPNNSVMSHLFDTLVTYDAKQNILPRLAVSWKPVDDTRWEFKLRDDVVFSDGTPLTAKDVVASLARVEVVPSVSSYRTYTRSIKSVEAVDPHLVRITTHAPTPLLPAFVTRIRIIKADMEKATTADFNSGKAAIGTGPYVLEKYIPGTRVTLKRNDKFWGEPESWDTVELRIVTDKASRLAALLSGDLDLIEAVPATDLDGLKSDKRFNVVAAESNRLIYLAMDQDRDNSPFVRDNDGEPMKTNPLKDLRVRRALSMAINREAIVKRVMNDQALAATQFLPVGRFGTSENIEPQVYDVEKAKALLKEAGYPDGFQLTVHASNDRYINDSRIIQTVAQFFSRIGIKAKTEVQPWSTYAGKVAGHEFSVALGGWAANTGETSNPMGAIIATIDKERGMGNSNYGSYSNPEFDSILNKALTTLDNEARAKLLAQCSEIAINDLAIIPLHHEVSVWAMAKNIQYKGRSDQFTMAMDARPAGTGQ